VVPPEQTGNSEGPTTVCAPLMWLTKLLKVEM